MSWDKTSEEYKRLAHELNDKSQFFVTKMLKKIHQKVDEDDRSLQPWKDHDKEFLAGRLKQEFRELKRELMWHPEWKNHVWEGVDREATQGELIDVANFCLFLYWALEEDE